MVKVGRRTFINIPGGSLRRSRTKIGGPKTERGGRENRNGCPAPAGGKSAIGRKWWLKVLKPTSRRKKSSASTSAASSMGTSPSPPLKALAKSSGASSSPNATQRSWLTPGNWPRPDKRSRQDRLGPIPSGLFSYQKTIF